MRKNHTVEICYDKSKLNGGDILFLVSCSQIIEPSERAKYRATLVLHASDLPKGRGWSPHIWSILGGSNTITVSLLEASDPVDSGLIWLKTTFSLNGDELIEEINAKLFKAELWLMTYAVEHFYDIEPTAQEGGSCEYLRKRTPADSKINIHKPLLDQFNLLRVSDSVRYPCFFEYKGCKYIIKIEKVVNEKNE